MKAVCFSSVEQVDYQDLPDPIIQADHDAVVEITSAGICGSDLHPYFGRETGIDRGTVLGHEFVGYVKAVGSTVKNLNIGDRVCAPFTTNCGYCHFCNIGLTARCTSGQLFGWRENGSGLHGGQATQVRVPFADTTLYPLQENISDEAAILLGDNLSTAFYATELASVDQLVSNDEESCVAVIGCGTVGLLAIQWAKAKGVKTVLAVEPNRHRREHAETLGAITCANSASIQARAAEVTSGLGVAAVMEFVGLPDAQRTAFEIIRPGGTLATIGCHCTPQFAFSPSQAYEKNLCYRSGRCSARHYMKTVQTLTDQHQLDLSWCVTHHFNFDQARLGYDTFANRREECVKAVFQA